MGEGTVDWEVFKVAFLDRLLLLELRQNKMVEFMNLHQGGISVKEYFVIFNQLYQYAQTIVPNTRSRMNKFVIRVPRLVEKEHRTTMLVNDMDISWLMVYP